MIKIRPLAQRPTGLQLHQVLIHDLAPQALILKPNDHAQFGGWAVDDSLLKLGLESKAQKKELLRELVSSLGDVCRKYNCTRLALRFESSNGDFILPKDLAPPGLTLTHSYRRLSTPLTKLKERLNETQRPTPQGIRVEQYPLTAKGVYSPWLTVPTFPPWFLELFESIFTPDTDREIAEAIPFQLALLELILAASWQHPRLNIIRHRNRAVGLIVSRTLEAHRGELSFVGLAPRVRGEKALGELLMRSGLISLEATKVRRVVCAVAIDNPRSFAFFTHRWALKPEGMEEVWDGEVSNL